MDELRSNQTPHTPVHKIREATATGCANKDKSQVVSGVHYRLNVITIKVMFRMLFLDCGQAFLSRAKFVNPLAKTAARFFPTRGKTSHSERSRPTSSSSFAPAKESV